MYFSYKGNTPNITTQELENKLAIAVGEWLEISDIHVEIVDEVEDEHSKYPNIPIGLL